MSETNENISLSHKPYLFPSLLLYQNVFQCPPLVGFQCPPLVGFQCTPLIAFQCPLLIVFLLFFLLSQLRSACRSQSQHG